jgi:hypothetical protein
VKVEQIREYEGIEKKVRRVDLEEAVEVALRASGRLVNAPSPLFATTDNL